MPSSPSRGAGAGGEAELAAQIVKLQGLLAGH